MYTQSIEIADPRFKRLVLGNVHLEKLHGGCRWAEGPAYFPAGRYLVWSDIPNNRMLRFDECDGSVSVFREPSNNTNGHTVDREGRLVSCEHRGRCVSRTEHNGTRTVLADQWRGKKLNSPNDVVVKSDGSIYFTDPWTSPDIQQQWDLTFAGVYRLTPDLGTLTLLVDDFPLPNGLAFSPDESVLYVNDSRRRHIRAFDLAPNGTLAKQTDRVFADLGGPDQGVPDGMKVDTLGNVYCGGAGGIYVLDPKGKKLGRIVHGQPATTNIGFGGNDWKTLFFTTRTLLGSVNLKVAGIPVPVAKKA
jgi:gluconolactonase